MLFHMLAIALTATLASVGGAPILKEAPARAAKPTVVLVHGAFADGSGWQKVIPSHPKEIIAVIKQAAESAK